MENFLDDTICILIGDCYFKEYKYTFVYGNEKYNADKCVDLLYGSNVCYYNNQEFYNVSYISEFMQERHVNQKGVFHITWPLLILLFITILLKLISESEEFKI